MAGSEVTLIKKLMQYKNTLEKSEDPEEKMSILVALDKLPVRVCHLEKTGIGKTVNNLRKFDHDENIVIAARELKDKWKNMALEFWNSEDQEETK